MTAPLAPSSGCMNEDNTKVTIVGGGVAALEAMIALHAAGRGAGGARAGHADTRVRLPPAGGGRAVRARRGEALRRGADRARPRRGAAPRGRPGGRPGRASRGRPGTAASCLTTCCCSPSARTPAVALPGSVTIQGPGYTGRFRTRAAASSSERRVRRVAFAVPSGGLLAAAPLRARADDRRACRRARTAQRRAVARHARAGAARAVRAAASAAVPELLEERGIAFHGGRAPGRGARRRARRSFPGRALAADSVVSLPRLRGPLAPGPAARPGRVHPHRPPWPRPRARGRVRRGRRHDLPDQAGRRRRPAGGRRRRGHRGPARRAARPASRSGRCCAACC